MPDAHQWYSLVISGVFRACSNVAPAMVSAAGELGIMPGSMVTPSYVVVSKSNADALMSTSQGAGRALGQRTQSLIRAPAGAIEQ